MQRWTARFLLLLLLAGVLAPAALALRAPAMHACCVRQGMRCHSAHEAQFATPACCGQGSRKPLMVSHWAESRSSCRASISPVESGLALRPRNLALKAGLDASQSGRAPPTHLFN